MAVYKCKMCGGMLDVSNAKSVVECEYCGVQQTIPSAKDENAQGLFNRANELRSMCEFDKAEKVYEEIIQSDETQAEAYWGLVLCQYGIEYVEDPATQKRKPTCHRASYESILADRNYKLALQHADALQKAVYEEQAREINEVQKGIIAIAREESPYDVFICYKETDENGRRTRDSVVANDIYYQLTQEGFKVFYAAITLEEKLGSEYEPIIFAALNSAKVMLVVGSKVEYFQAVWVKNEWSRFLKIMKKDRSKLLIPCYKDIDAYDLPEEFSHLQAQDMNKIGFINDIVRGIKKVIDKSTPAPQAQNATPAMNTTSGNNQPTPTLSSLASDELKNLWNKANKAVDSAAVKARNFIEDVKGNAANKTSDSVQSVKKEETAVTDAEPANLPMPSEEAIRKEVAKDKTIKGLLYGGIISIFLWWPLGVGLLIYRYTRLKKMVAAKQEEYRSRRK